jgi:hypothetical protein
MYGFARWVAESRMNRSRNEKRLPVAITRPHKLSQLRNSEGCARLFAGSFSEESTFAPPHARTTSILMPSTIPSGIHLCFGVPVGKDEFMKLTDRDNED